MNQIGLAEFGTIAAFVAASLFVQVLLVALAVLLAVYVWRRWFKTEQSN